MSHSSKHIDYDYLDIVHIGPGLRVGLSDETTVEVIFYTKGFNPFSKVLYTGSSESHKQYVLKKVEDILDIATFQNKKPANVQYEIGLLQRRLMSARTYISTI